MTVIYCHKNDCKYRNNKKSQKKTRGGESLYRCTKTSIVIVDFLDRDLIDCPKSIYECLGYESKNYIT